MSKLCIITGKHPLVGNYVSKSKCKVKRRFLPNLQKFSFLDEDNKKIRLFISVKGARIVRRIGIAKALNKGLKFTGVNCG
jgi:large subunit ribosomal protein L28